MDLLLPVTASHAAMVVCKRARSVRQGGAGLVAVGLQEHRRINVRIFNVFILHSAEWLACWTQAQKAWVATLSGNSLRQTAHTHRASKQRNW